MCEEMELHRDPDAASEMAVNAVLRYLHECDVEGDQKKRQWIQAVFDRVMSKELSQ